MRISEMCAECLYDRQKNRTDDEAYLAEVKRMLDTRTDEECSPYMVYRFNRLYEKLHGSVLSYAAEKKKYNDLVLSLEDEFRRKIEEAPDPVERALAYARAGNYIDFGAMDHVDQDTFLGLFDEAALRREERGTYEAFLRECASGERFLLLADNCGEIVLDKLLLMQLAKRFPRLRLQVMVRGGEILNDVTEEDALYTGIGSVAEIIPNGKPLAGTVYELLSEEARQAVDRADVILSKGQGNYESLSGQGRHIFYAFLCKCALFTTRFQVPKLTGMLVEER